MTRRMILLGWAATTVALSGALIVIAQEKKAEKAAPVESERRVKEAEVPAAALEALKKMAGGAAFTEFAEEIEHGHTYYEGSWKAPDGNVDCLVTADGAVVELEENIPADKVPAGVKALVEKEAGKDAKCYWEKKSLYLYEVHFKKDGKGREMIFLADGRRFHEEGGQDEGGDGDDDEKEGG